jgi:hypothetical protein
MPASVQLPDNSDDETLAALTRAYAAIVDEARAQVAAGREPNFEALEARLRAAASRTRSRAHAERTAGIDEAERSALQQLGRVATVHRARLRLTREPSQPPAPVAAAPRPFSALLRTKPTITGNMDVRREERDGALLLRWDAAVAVTGWEVRFSERPDARSDYVVRDTLDLPASSTEVEVPLGKHPMRVHLLGRSRDGRLLRRALISTLTRETWNERWQRRPSAS